MTQIHNWVRLNRDGNDFFIQRLRVVIELSFPWVVVIFLLNGCRKDQFHWSNVNKISGAVAADRLNKVLFIDSLNGYIFGGDIYQQAVILSTHDGGNFWQRQELHNVSQLLVSASVGYDGTVYGIGFEGKIVWKHVGDTSWSFKQIEDYYYRDIAVPASGEVIVIGGISFASGERLRMGANWQLKERDSFDYQLSHIKMISPDSGFACGYGILQVTADSGKTWTALTPSRDNFTGMDVLGSDIWICGYYGSIFHSADRGKSWERFRNGNDLAQQQYRLMDIKFTDALNGWAVGEHGLVIYTNDGGHHWVQYQPFTSNPLYSIAILPGRKLIICGDYGTLFKLIY